MKYIRFKNRGFVIFEEFQDHKNIAELIGDEVESAGFVHAIEWCEDGKICCSRDSFTLNKRAGPTDTEDLRRRFARI